MWDVMIHSWDSLVKCRDSLVKCWDSLVKCRDSLVKCWDSLVKCKDSLVKCRNSLGRCGDSLGNMVVSLEMQWHIGFWCGGSLGDVVVAPDMKIFWLNGCRCGSLVFIVAHWFAMWLFGWSCVTRWLIGWIRCCLSSGDAVSNWLWRLEFFPHKILF